MIFILFLIMGETLCAFLKIHSVMLGPQVQPLDSTPVYIDSKLMDLPSALISIVGPAGRPLWGWPFLVSGRIPNLNITSGNYWAHRQQGLGPPLRRQEAGPRVHVYSNDIVPKLNTFGNRCRVFSKRTCYYVVTLPNL